MSDRDKIKSAIDSIEPREGAKERMLANIRLKAAAEKSQIAPAAKRNVPMFMKIAKWALPIAACLVIAMTAVRVIPILTAPPYPDDDQGVMVGNPFETVNSPEEFEKRLGIKINAPEGADNIKYAMIDNSIAEIFFSFDGSQYLFRASEQSGDFSGLNGVEAASEQLDGENSAVLFTIKSGADTFLKLTWTDGRINYILSNTDGGSANEITKIYELVK